MPSAPSVDVVSLCTLHVMAGLDVGGSERNDDGPQIEGNVLFVLLFR
jgi:hypothetical protein